MNDIQKPSTDVVHEHLVRCHVDAKTVWFVHAQVELLGDHCKLKAMQMAGGR